MVRESDKAPTVKLKANPDIAAALGKRKTGQFLIGFALETGEGYERAVGKMKRKGCDMMVRNMVSSSLGGTNSHMTLLCPDAAPEPLPLMSKRDCALAILWRAAQRMGLKDG
jgi:phosphopantothenoylcysteine decarboxylase/phosphopantothenate--cysteine ligase